jgi:hypothetical protein
MMAWQCISPKVILKGFKKRCISSTVDETEDDMLWNDTEEDGSVTSWVWGRTRHWLWRQRQWHWLIKLDRICHALCIQYTKLIAKYFFLSRCFIWGGGVILDSGRYGIIPACLEELMKTITCMAIKPMFGQHFEQWISQIWSRFTNIQSDRQRNKET